MTSCEVASALGVSDRFCRGGGTGPLTRLRQRLASAMAERRVRVAIVPPALDERTLRDIGLTGQGVRECVLAARNEARVPRAS